MSVFSTVCCAVENFGTTDDRRLPGGLAVNALSASGFPQGNPSPAALPRASPDGTTLGEPICAVAARCCPSQIF